MMHEVIAYMHSLGYQVFDMEVAAAWKHGNINETSISGKQKAIGYEILFVKNVKEVEADKKNSFLKFLLLLELYGYRDYAIYLLKNIKGINHDLSKQLLKLFLLNSHNEQKLLTKIKNKAIKSIRNFQLYPKINY